MEQLIKLAAEGNKAALLMIQDDPAALEAVADLLVAQDSDPEQTRFERRQRRAGLLLDEVNGDDGEDIVVEGIHAIEAITANRRPFEAEYMATRVARRFDAIAV